MYKEAAGKMSQALDNLKSTPTEGNALGSETMNLLLTKGRCRTNKSADTMKLPVLRQRRLTPRFLLTICFGTIALVLFINISTLNRLQDFSNVYNRIMSTASASPETSDSLTVVTAYFNLGSFLKGPSMFTPSLYQQWMTIFDRIENPVIAFMDNEADFRLFVSIRSKLPQNLTKVIKINRNNTWAFGLENRIAEIFNNPEYPRHHPNTVVPGYSAAMHAKYELMQRVIRENPFHTKYFAWLDIGLFRDIALPNSFSMKAYSSKKSFTLELSHNFSTDSVAYTKVYERNPQFSAKDLVYGNEVWLCGCYFVGEGSVLYRWTEEYKNATEAMLSYNLMSTDQQVIYFMFNSLNPKTKIQTYSGDGRFNEWFHLGYISRKVS